MRFAWLRTRTRYASVYFSYYGDYYENIPIFEYEVDLQDTWLIQSSPDGDGDVVATSDSFEEKNGVVYWLSISAMNGVEVERVDGASWAFSDVADPEYSQFWGWQASPDDFQGVTMVTLIDFFSSGFSYDSRRQPRPPVLGHDPGFDVLPHTFEDMAFELLTLNNVNTDQADFDQDGDVDGDDFLLWQIGFGAGITSGATKMDGDYDNDGDVDGDDFLGWQAESPSPGSGPASTEVPEPTSAVLLLVALVGAVFVKR